MIKKYIAKAKEIFEFRNGEHYICLDCASEYDGFDELSEYENAKEGTICKCRICKKTFISSRD